VLAVDRDGASVSVLDDWDSDVAAAVVEFERH